jgi:endogenous inhibitor of DNA gyrase (YacG/DUF329 family)
MEGTEAEWPYLPFCGERCRGIDLGRWLGETYRVPATEDSVERLDEQDIP